MVRRCSAVIALAILVITSLATSAYAQEKSSGLSATDSVAAVAAGKEAAQTHGATGAALMPFMTSTFLPFSGFALELFEKGDKKPSYAEEQSLAGKSPDYRRIWVQSLEKETKGRKQRAGYIGAGVGTVLGLILYSQM